MEKLVIDRSKWIRGIEPRACLLDDKGNMCCLGFECIRQGFDSKYLLHEMTPQDVANVEKRPVVNLAQPVPDVLGDETWDENWKAYDTAKAVQLMGINDSYEHTEEEREEMIAACFSAVGVQVEFVGEGNPYQDEIDELAAQRQEDESETEDIY